MRILRIANYVAPRSGGLKTALRHLGAGYQAAGHEAVLVIPGERASRAAAMMFPEFPLVLTARSTSPATPRALICFENISSKA